MEASDAKQFTELMTALAATFGRNAGEALLLGYRMGLEDLPIKSIKTAIGKAMREKEYMPTVAELRCLAGVMTLTARAALAWEAFGNAVQRVGYYGSPDFDDKVINAVAWNLGGWMRCCDLPAEDFDKWLRKDFEKIYVQFFNAGIGDEQAMHLVGYHEKMNLSSGAVMPDGSKWELKITHVKTGLPALPSHVLRLTNQSRPVVVDAEAVPQIEFQKP